jgi:hypothetical protein
LQPSAQRGGGPEEALDEVAGAGTAEALSGAEVAGEALALAIGAAASGTAASGAAASGAAACGALEALELAAVGKGAADEPWQLSSAAAAARKNTNRVYGFMLPLHSRRPEIEQGDVRKP